MPYLELERDANEGEVMPLGTIRLEGFGDELHMTFICPHCDKRSYIDAPPCCYDDYSDDGAVYPDTLECPRCRREFNADFSEYEWAD
jgi:hypothetical protein